jgi:tetratricopeptide (TPR) repeat protein
MSKCLSLGAMLIASIVLQDGAGAQVSSPTGSQGRYDEHGKDYGYDNMQSDTASRDEFAIGAALVKQQEFSEAITHLELARAKHPRNVTILIYLGFAHRMIGSKLTGDAQGEEFNQALDFYQKALAIDSNNRILHEYLGKLYLLTRQYTLASNELKTLGSLCPSGCDERTALTQSIAANPEPPSNLGAPTRPH